MTPGIGLSFMERPEFKAAAVFLLIAMPIVLTAWLLKTVMLPIVIASVVYVLLDPAVNLLQQRGLNKVLAITLVLTVLFGLLVWFVVTMVPLLAAQFASFRESLPTAWENLSALITRLEAWLNTTLGLSFEQGGLLQSATAALRGFSGTAVRTVSGGLANFASWLLLIPIIAFFFLRDFRSLRNTILDWLPNHMFEKTLGMYHKVSQQLEVYVRSVMLQSLIMAVVTGIGFTLVGLPLAVLLGILAGVFNLIPYIGPLLALVAPLLVALSISIDPMFLAMTVGVIVVGQLVDNLIVVPTILARAANLHPLIALLAIIVAGNLFGLLGMVFALPVLASARIIFVGVLVELKAA